jgi:hypothetical protein
MSKKESLSLHSVVNKYELNERQKVAVEAIKNNKLTIAVGRFPEAPGQFRNIIINDNILYTHMDGKDVIGLIAQGDIHIGMESQDNLTIHGAMIAKNGRVGRLYYRGPWNNRPGCSPHHIKNYINVY